MLFWKDGGITSDEKNKSLKAGKYVFSFQIWISLCLTSTNCLVTLLHRVYYISTSTRFVRVTTQPNEEEKNSNLEYKYEVHGQI